MHSKIHTACSYKYNIIANIHHKLCYVYYFSDLSIEKNVEDLITKCSFDKLQEIVKKLTPQLVKKLDLNPMLDHFIASRVLLDNTVEEFENNSTTLTQRNLNRWFLRNVLSKGNLQVLYAWLYKCTSYGQKSL